RPTSWRTGSRCSTPAGSSPPARPRSSSGGCRAATSGSGSPTCRRSTPPARPSAAPTGTTSRSASPCPATAASARCGRCWTSSTGPRSRSTTSPSTPPISTTSSSPSPEPGRAARNEHLPGSHARASSRRSARGAADTAFARPRRQRLDDHAAPPAQAHAALPVDDRAAGRHAGGPAVAVRVRLRRNARRRPAGVRRRLRPRGVPGVRDARDPAADDGGDRAGHRDLGGHGHDRGDHRAVPNQAALAVVFVLAVELALGFRPDASAVEWLAVAGFAVLVAFALAWLCVALGLASKSVETASNTPMFLLLLPFLGSGFVPTDSMPAGLRWFAEHQPFTPMTETLRGLLSGTPIGTDGIVAVAWCVVIALGSYLWARRQLARRPVR